MSLRSSYKYYLRRSFFTMLRYTMWKCLPVYCILLYLVALTLCQKTALDSSSNVMMLRAFRNWMYNVIGRTGMEARFLQAAKNANKMQPTVPNNVSFPCNITDSRSQEEPKSVHKLKPGDVDVIASMGDSLLAGAGALGSFIPHILIDNRGVSASGGGQGTWRQFFTLPNILKKFNPNLVGYALGDSLTIHAASQLNVAESGAMSEDMPYMAKILIKRIKQDPRIDLEKHWKLISIFIGANDFCSDVCWISSPWSILEKHKRDLLQVLRTLRDNLPRTFVALILLPQLQPFIDAVENKGTLFCHIATNFACSCLRGLAFRRFRPIYYDILTKWQELDMEIAAYPEFQRNDFAVVTQPFLTNLTLPTGLDEYMSYFSVDCLHGSQKLYSLFAIGQWNNLLEPEGAKSVDIPHTLFEKFLCPTPERPYLATMLN